MRRLALLVLAFLAARAVAADAPADGAAYAAVQAELARWDNRLPGSPGHEASLKAVEAALAGAGLTTHRQTYETLVPKTSVCRLRLAGADVAGVHPLAPNGIALRTTWGGPVTGPLLYVGDGSLAALDGKPVAGAIAVLELGSSHLGDVFSQGARAVVFVGNEQATQWSVDAAFTSLPVSMPCVWIDRGMAEAAGLLAADGKAEASLELAQSWAPVRGVNLWAKIPARPRPAPAADDEAERALALVLSANLDTFGAIPELSPQLRWADNAALLAEVAARLARQPLERPVYALFLGSHYGAQDGARQFYYVVAKTLKSAKDGDGLEAREKDLCQAQLDHADQLLALLAGNAFVADKGDDQDELYVMAKSHLIGVVNDINFELRGINLEQRAAERALTAIEKAGATDDPAQLRARRDALAKRVDELGALKSGWNGLRAQLANKKVLDAAAFAKVDDWMAAQLRARKEWFTTLLADTRSSRELEDALRAAGPDAPAEAIAGHFAFDFASDARPWMFSPFGATVWSRGHDVGAGTFSRQLKAYKDAWAAMPAAEGLADLWTPDASATWRFDALCTPHQRIVPAAVPHFLGIAGFQLQTIGDPLDLDEMPARDDRPLARLAPRLADFVRALAALPGLPAKTDFTPETPVTRLTVTASGTKLQGVQTVDFAKGTEDVQGPSENAILAVGGLMGGMTGAEPRYSTGVSDIAFARVGPTGHVFMPQLVELPGNGTGNQIHAWGFDEHGGIDRFVDAGHAVGNGPRAVLTYGVSGAFFTPFLPADYAVASVGRMLVARSDTEPKQKLSAGSSALETFFADQPKPFKYLGNGIDMLGASDGVTPAAGQPFDPRAMLALDPNRVAARDLAALNLGRLKTLRSRNIINKPLERLQADAEEHLELADEARGQGRSRLGVAHEAVADIIGNRVHQPLRDNANDLVRAVVILLLLCLPFAFALERLVFGFTSIYKQIGGFVGIFLATFGVLYETHPAFSLAEAPVIIFLAFIIILLSAFTIYVVMGKFKHELRAMQGLSSKAHGGGGESGTAFAAVAIGISGMRNRPLKTFLTAATVALLTFTILVFASFSSSLGVVSTYVGASTGPQRIEFHTPSFLAIPGRLIDAIATVYGDRYDVRVRAASFRDPTMVGAKDDVVNIALNPATMATQPLEAVLVVDPAEIPQLDKLFAPLAAGAAGAPPILLPQVVAKQLGAAVGDRLRLRGQEFALAGIFEGAVLKRLENADGTRLVPPNFDATFAASGARADGLGNLQNAFKSLDVNDFIFSSADMVAITTYEGMGKLGVTRNLLALYPKPGAAIEDDARELAEWVEGPVVASTDAGVKRFFFTQAIEGSGLLEVLVPLLLGGLIIFSSLLGSIVDRQKEIFTFSALGLAPPDVAVLFFAESAVFAVLGGMGGYLISQVVVKLLSVLAAFGIANVPDVNFSSFSSIVTILIVMATVMLSTIYPAIMAGRSANPGVARKWRMPKPDGDRLAFTFPFTVSADSISGILAFIREHFDNHGDASLGAFAARDVAIVSRPRAGGGRDMGITAEIALAPFDLGVFQRFSMMTRPSDIAGIDEVVVELTRLNGAPGTWLRGNRPFIDDLREQFLRWRSLPIDSVEHYHALAEGAFGVAAENAFGAAGANHAEAAHG